MRKYDAGGLDFQGESNTLLAEQFHLCTLLNLNIKNSLYTVLLHNPFLNCILYTLQLQIFAYLLNCFSGFYPSYWNWDALRNELS